MTHTPPRRSPIAWLLAGALVCAAATLTQALEPRAPGVQDARVLRRSYVFDGTDRAIPYAVFVPPTYNPATPAPLIIGLHGLGQTYDWLMGYDGFLDMAGRDGYIVVTPLGYSEYGWFGSAGPLLRSWQVPPLVANVDPPPADLGARSERDVLNVLDLARQEFRIDPRRIFLWGHSMGGGGALHLASKYPELWRALAVAAPSPDATVEELQQLRRLPVLVLQGDKDSAVPVAKTRATVERMKTLGLQFSYVEVPGGDHTGFLEHGRETLARVFAFFGAVR